MGKQLQTEHKPSTKLGVMMEQKRSARRAKNFAENPRHHLPPDEAIAGREPLLTPPERRRNRKPRNARRVLTKTWNYIKVEWKGFALALVLIVVANLLMLQGPRYSGEAIDAIGLFAGDTNFPEVWRNSFLMIFFYLISFALDYLSVRVLVRVVQIVMSTMRQDTFNKIVELPLSYIDSHQAGDLVSRISYDLDLVAQAMNNDIVRVLASSITIFGSLIMMFIISWELALMFLLMIPITVAFTIWRTKRTRPLFSRRSAELGRMNAYVEEILSGQKTINAYGQEEFFVESFDEVNDSSINAYYKADYQGSLNGPSVSLISNISLALVALFGALLTLNGRFTIGSLSSFVLYSRRFSGPINQVANIYVDLQSAASAAERVYSLLEEASEPEDAPDAIELTNVKGKVEFRNVSFEYVPDTPVIKDLSFVAEPGTLTAIVGPTGAGKTTLVNLLMRFYDPQEGQILVDDIDITKITRKSLRQSFAMVLQDSWLFSGTIRENIAYGDDEATDEDVKLAAEASYMDDFIESQEDGYDSVISDSASNLSQGQKQLLTISRAMLLDSPMLILDEATSNVDSRTEVYIQNAMNTLIEGRTSFVIAHRLSTIQNADNIIVINSGEIAEQGTHEELLAHGGIYNDLYESQFVR